MPGTLSANPAWKYVDVNYTTYSGSGSTFADAVILTLGPWQQIMRAYFQPKIAWHPSSGNTQLQAAQGVDYGTGTGLCGGQLSSGGNASGYGTSGLQIIPRNNEPL